MAPTLKMNYWQLGSCPHILKTWIFPDIEQHPANYSNPRTKPENNFVPCVRNGRHQLHRGWLHGEEKVWS
jgi:hypothetical protein